jgi:hypothetical protein
VGVIDRTNTTLTIFDFSGLDVDVVGREKAFMSVAMSGPSAPQVSLCLKGKSKKPMRIRLP